MTIEVKESLLHWNYFLALTSDLESVSRYIEFSNKNFETYSIELAHLLLASASEVDVVLKGICRYIDPNSNPENINQYREIILPNTINFPDEEVFISRYGITLTPWSNWRNKDSNPIWWKYYNKVKHQRDEYFEQANLRNALNSLAGLLIVVFYYYKNMFIRDMGVLDDNREITIRLLPESDFFRLKNDYYYRKAYLP